MAFIPYRSATSFTVTPGGKLSDTIHASTSSGHWRCASRQPSRVVRTSAVVSMGRLLVALQSDVDHRSGARGIRPYQTRQVNVLRLQVVGPMVLNLTEGESTLGGALLAQVWKA